MSQRTLEKNVTLLDLLDKMLDKGVVASGDVMISVADVDLIYVGLRALAGSLETMEQHGVRPDRRGTQPQSRSSR